MTRLAVATCAACLGCGGGGPAPAAPAGGPPPETSSVQRYMPLEDGTVYAYDTENENSGERGLLVMKVSRPRAGRVDLKVGNRVRRLDLVPDGIRLVEGGYLLKAPLTRGATWRGTDSRIEVRNVDRTVEVPAGKFVGCIETVETAGTAAAGKKVTTVYCPDVGIALLEVEGVVDDDYSHERAALRSFGPPVDIGAAPE